ncbi:MAG TPA: M20 family metallopeptidase [Streptosporangiaceae bacterium]|nr:M20 family metallopeptidase [Streptosporangiaceae bacterium]
MDLADGLRTNIAELQPGMMALRHRLHQRPEIGLELPETQRAVLEALDGLPLEVSVGGSCSSVTAVLRGTAERTDPAPAVLLRGDMDALPVHELADVEYRSKVDGVMHACGHDLHTAMLAGAARLLSAHRDVLHGDVVFMFQPGEEGMNGAGHMIDEGILDAAGTRVQRAYGVHVASAELPRHQLSTRPGTLMAASDWLSVTVVGAGGHGSAPHHAKDPVSVAAEIVVALQTMVTRQFDIFDPVVVTVGSFHAGTRRNIIPGEATFEATVRSFSPGARAKIEETSVRLCQDIAAAHGLRADVRYHQEYPVTVNDASQAEFAAGVVAEVFGPDRFTLQANPEAGAEDFSRVLEQVPGCYLFLGACPHDDYASAPDNHSAYAQFDDSVMPDGCLLHASLAIKSLQSLAGY